MNRWLSLILGPELYWIILYVVFRWLAARNVPPTASGNTTLNWAIWLVATVGVLLSFAAFAVPGVNRWILFIRHALAAFIGLNACVIAACAAIKYPELGRDSGLMALWYLAVAAGGVLWILAAIVAIILFWIRTKA